MDRGKDGTVTAKIFGSVLVIIGCAGFGFRAAASHIREEFCLKQLLFAISAMRSHLNSRLVPLPALCDLAGSACGGPVGAALRKFSGKLEKCSDCNMHRLMESILIEDIPLPDNTQSFLLQLIAGFGGFDLDEQLRELDRQASEISNVLNSLEQDRQSRLRGYKTLGLCAGAAIVILFI